MRPLATATLAFAALSIFFLHVPARAELSPEAFPRELEADLSAGATAIYHLDFEAAERHLNNAVRLHPGHPAAYFFFAMAKWYELSYDSLLRRDPRIEKQFEQHADRAIAVAKKFSKRRETEAAGNLYWGGGLGAKGWNHVARRQWVRAYFAGKKGYGLLKRAVQIEPALYDAYLGVGMYEYYAATLGPVLKALSSFVVRGNREQALKYMGWAETRSRYVRTEAAYFLWNAAIDENRLGDAHAKIRELLHIFPRSPLFLWCEVQTLYVERRWEEVIRKCREYSHGALAGPDPQDHRRPERLILAKVYFHQAAAEFNLKRYDQARAMFERCAREPAEFSGWKSMANLRLGELDDMEGHRERAIQRYRAVLALPDAWDSHDLARHRLDTPFRLTRETEIIPTPLQRWKKEIE